MRDDEFSRNVDNIVTMMGGVIASLNTQAALMTILYGKGQLTREEILYVFDEASADTSRAEYIPEGIRNGIVKTLAKYRAGFEGL